MKKTVITSALPYANGPIHLGHLVEYIQTDIYSRFLKLKGEHAIYCCADDTHGAPIEINAAKQGVTPEEFIARYYEEHQKDFADFHIRFDSFYSTNSPENKELSDTIFTRLRERGDIYTKEIDLTYCEACARFLPDRYVRGRCPRCNAEDQYGDNCEKCNSTYQPTELISPRCSLCGSAPSLKTSLHYFFKLTAYAERLRKWISEDLKAQDSIKNFCYNWIDTGLKDWDISRDAPYFGFPIAGETDKYYYVWLDAPIGYMASTRHYCSLTGENFDDYWSPDSGRVIHFIGKDIIYFHFLFWPATLMGAGFNLPEAIYVHGFLTVNGEKMSTSRGTFLTARDYLERLDPEYLRFYYASHLSSKVSDIDLDFTHFRDIVNGQLVDNICNFANRVLKFGSGKLDGKLCPVDGPPEEERVRTLTGDILKQYETLEFQKVMRGIMELGDIGNLYIQEQEPWKQIRENPEKARETVSRAVDLLRRISILLRPVLPALTGRLFEQIGTDPQDMSRLENGLGEHELGTPEPLMPRIDEIDLVKK